MADTFSGSTGNLPTWQYVQNVITDNIDKAEGAINLANEYIEDLSLRYDELWAEVGNVGWWVDVNIATDAPVDRTGTVTINAVPTEPDYTGDEPSEVTVPQVTVPSGITNVQSAPEWDLTLDEVPATPTLLPYSALPTLEPLPEITALVPTMDVDLLTTEFSFTEPTYTERVSPEVQVEIERVLGGDMGIPQAYWDDLWEKVSGDLARQQLAVLRNARNRGAATYWGLPTETVLVASRAAQDEGTKKLTIARLEQAQQQAVFAREDFWKAIQAGIEYENQWLGFHNQMAARALTAAEQLVILDIQMHNANVQRYNMMLDAAKTTLQIEDLEIQAVLKKYEALLRQNQAEIEQNKGTISVYTAEVQAYSVSQTTQIQAIAEKIKWWNSTWDADTRYKALQQEKAKLDISNYSAILSKIDSISRATSSLLGARTGVAEYVLKNQLGLLEQQKIGNATSLDLARLTQSAQEIKAKLDVAQIEWLGGQGNALLQNVAQLASGLAQALVTVSDVNLGSAYSASDSWSTSYNHSISE